LCVQPTRNPDPEEEMSWLVGAVTIASAVTGVMLGQVTAGAEFMGVVLAGLTLMTVRA